MNAGAVVRYVRMWAPHTVTLVRMGHEARGRCEEDDLCAQIIELRLRGSDADAGDVREKLRSAAGAAKFFDPVCHWAPERDFELCTRLDAFDFVLELEPDAERARLCRVDVQ